MRAPTRVVAVGIVVAAACATFRFFGPFASANDGWFKLLTWTAPILVIVRVLFSTSWRDAIAQLGLSRSPVPGILFGFTATLPATLAFLWGIPWHLGPGFVLTRLFVLVETQVRETVGNTTAGAFAEEVLFRGFLMSQLVIGARWSVRHAIIASAVAFGLAHLANGGGVQFMVQSMLAMTFGGAVFGWLFARWESLWPAIALHAALNAWWVLDKRIAAIWQIPMIALAILITIWKAPAASAS